jgi:hypothetical protein
VSGFELVAGVIAAFFVIGVGVGVLLVIALSPLRRRRGLPANDGSPGTGWGRPAGPGGEDEARRWPGS